LKPADDRGAGKTILVDPGVYHLLNIGDTAMLAAATRRLRGELPGARILVFTDAPNRLKQFCPEAEPISAAGRQDWFREWTFLGKLGSAAPGPVQGGLRRLDETLRARPGAGGRLVLAKQRLRRRPTASTRAFLDALATCDLFLLCGMGAITDGFPEAAHALLGITSMAQRRGIPTALMGQGIGPLEDPGLREVAAQVLPNVQLLALREEAGGLPLSVALGVPRDRIRVTGDDGLALVTRRPWERRGSFGLNLRVAAYTGISAAAAEELAGVVVREAERRAVPVVEIAISYGVHERDAGAGAPAPADFGVIDRIGTCSLVVACSYHAAVFALAQGVPVVALTASRYYDWKFAGLAGMFPGGLTVVDVREGDAGARLADAIAEARATEESVRMSLVETAVDLEASGRAAYAEAAALVA
jgi:polysaccharide pyruvyl transferase WcaK-like protein